MTDVTSAAKRTSLIEKIRNLIARATHANANRHEAEACAAKAAELMERYNIEKEAVAVAGSDEVIKDISFAATQKWDVTLLCIICEVFKCKPIRSADGKLIHVVGDALALELLEYMYVQLKNKTNALAKEFGNAWLADRLKVYAPSQRAAAKKQLASTKTSAVGAFKKGVTHGLNQQFQDQKKAARAAGNQSGLVKVERAIAEYTAKKFGPTQRGQTRSSRVNTEGYNAGKAAGAGMQMNKGVGTKQKLLG